MRAWQGNIAPMKAKSQPAKYAMPSDAELRERLTPLAYRVTRRDATEPPFDNAYHDEKRDGLYVDAVSGAPLFCSRDKFDSGTGWPSFTGPLEPANLGREDRFQTIHAAHRSAQCAW